MHRESLHGQRCRTALQPEAGATAADEFDHQLRVESALPGRARVHRAARLAVAVDEERATDSRQRARERDRMRARAADGEGDGVAASSRVRIGDRLAQ
jgi:hypothetical protein